MKSTKIMLAAIATFILTWLFLGFIVYMCSTGATYKDCTANVPLGLVMFVVGWIPTVIVCMDLDEKLQS